MVYIVLTELVLDWARNQKLYCRVSDRDVIVCRTTVRSGGLGGVFDKSIDVLCYV